MSGQQVEAHVAQPPAGSDRVPGVLLFMDALGVRPRIVEMAERIASWGYAVLAPNVFHRSGSVAEVCPPGPLLTAADRESFFAVARPRIGALTPDLFLADLPDYVAALDAQPGVDPGAPLGVVGYCMGARLAVRAACALPDRVAAAAGFHGGGLATDAPDSPHLGLTSARARFVFGHADADPSMDADAVARLGAALSAAGLEATNEIWAGVRHGYTMSDMAVHDAAATERHFAALRDLFARTLG